MRLREVLVETSGSTSTLVGRVERRNGERFDLYFAFSGSLPGPIETSADAFIPALLIPAMLAGEALESDLPRVVFMKGFDAQLSKGEGLPESEQRTMTVLALIGRLGGRSFPAALPPDYVAVLERDWHGFRTELLEAFAQGMPDAGVPGLRRAVGVPLDAPVRRGPQAVAARGHGAAGSRQRKLNLGERD